jgi:catechol 2,3-dioxygenase-like lactoylglutathione lyase family enzyme
MTPLVQVFDMGESLAFYTAIGFQVVAISPMVTTREGTFSHWMRLAWGDEHLMLNTAYDSNERPASRDLARTQAHGDTVLHFDVPDVAATRAALEPKVNCTAIQENHGRRHFSIRDPDGFELVFQS